MDFSWQEEERERPVPHFAIGDRFVLSDDALENYGEELRGIVYTVDNWYDHVSSFNLKPDPHGHVYFNDDDGSCLYHSDFRSDLYEWEMVKVD